MIPKRFLICISVFIVSISHTLADIVCLRKYIGGFEKEHEIGCRYTGKNTTSISNSNLYITTNGNQLYVQSNFLIDNTSEYPTKLAVTLKDDYRIEDYIANIYFPGRTEPLSSSEIHEYLSVLHNNVNVIVEPSFFNTPKFCDFDFSKFKNLHILCPDNIIRECICLINKNGTIEYLIKFNENIYIRIKNQNLEYIFLKIMGHPVFLWVPSIYCGFNNS